MLYEQSSCFLLKSLACVVQYFWLLSFSIPNCCLSTSFAGVFQHPLLVSLNSPFLSLSTLLVVAFNISSCFSPYFVVVFHYLLLLLSISLLGFKTPFYCLLPSLIFVFSHTAPSSPPPHLNHHHHHHRICTIIIITTTILCSFLLCTAQCLAFTHWAVNLLSVPYSN